MACACGCCQKQLGPLCPSGVIRMRMAQVLGPPMVPLGELRGVIYRKPGLPGEAPKNYVHFFTQAPLLAADSMGRKLFILGGHYQVTKRGIEG